MEVDNFNSYFKRIYSYGEANSTLYFTPPDTRKLFEENLSKHPDNEDLLHYKNNPIKYKLNDYGFRTPDNFDDTDGEGNVFLGCSHTFGIGHYLKNTWAWRLNQKIGGKFWNLSVPGTGIGTAARLLGEFKNKLKIKNIFLYTPFCYRYEIFDGRKKLWLSVSPVNVFHYHFQISEEARFMLGQEENMRLYWRTNLAAIKYYADEIGAKLHSIKNIDFFLINKNIQPPNLPEIARDIDHPGVSYQDLVYNNFLEAYEKDLPLNEEPESSFKPLKTII